VTVAVPGRVKVNEGVVPKAPRMSSPEPEKGVSGMTIATLALCSPWTEVTAATAVALPSTLVAPLTPMAMERRDELTVPVAVSSIPASALPTVAESGASACTTADIGTLP